MMPTSEQIEAEGVARAKRCGREVAVSQDFEEARVSLFLHHNYDLVHGVDLSARAASLLGKREPQTCRYCQHSGADFATDAHTIPECLGNRTLISLDECDACNQKFSMSFESHLDRMTAPIRAMLGIVGKKGAPTHKLLPGTSKIRFDAATNTLLVMDPDGSLILSQDHERRIITYMLRCARYVPLEAYRALVKIGLVVYRRGF
jgi:HNH endonuclease